MNLRHPMRAGSFYEASPSSCRHHAAKLIDSAALPEDLPSAICGGVVPHAGWSYSGPLAALALKALVTEDVGTVVLLGADHCGTVRKGEVFDSGVWRTPLGDVEVDAELAAALLGSAKCLRANPEAHAYEHSLEVQVPIIQVLSPRVKILPIGVPPTELAVEIGRAIGAAVASRQDVRIVGSSDLTHHAGHFPAPGGRGLKGVEWTERNDRRMLDLIEAMKAADVVTEAQANGNACGAGAIAAAVEAAKVMGASRGICLGYTNSYRIIREMYPDESDDTTVGYAAVVFA